MGLSPPGGWALRRILERILCQHPVGFGEGKSLRAEQRSETLKMQRNLKASQGIYFEKKI